MTTRISLPVDTRVINGEYSKRAQLWVTEEGFGVMDI